MSSLILGYSINIIFDVEVINVSYIITTYFKATVMNFSLDIS